MTSPHGLAAWIGWSFGIAAPFASTFVAIVALRLARRDKAVEAAEKLTKATAAARLVSVTYTTATGGWERFDDPDRDPSRAPLALVKVNGTLMNNSGEAIVGLHAAPWIAETWAERASPEPVDPDWLEVGRLPLELTNGASVDWIVQLIIARHPNRAFEVPVRREIRIPVNGGMYGAAFCDLGIDVSWSDSDGRRWTRPADGPTEPFLVTPA